MTFDPYDPIDPLGQDQPYEMQNHSADLPPTQAELDTASRDVLEKAQLQAAGESPIIWNTIEEELNRRDLDIQPSEPISEQDPQTSKDEYISNINHGSCAECDETATLIGNLCISCMAERAFSSGSCNNCSSHSDILVNGLCPICSLDKMDEW